MKKLLMIVPIAAFVLMAASYVSPVKILTPIQVEHDELGNYEFDDEGNLIRPEGYRLWVYVGTPVTPNELNPPTAPFPEFHNVYIHPQDFEYYSTTGKFRDGTIIMKELVTVGSKQAVSGNGYFMGEFAGLEATIKDSKRFPDEPGNWAYFSFGHKADYEPTAKAFPAGACNSCHAVSAADDFVFTQYYPVLSAAKGGDGIMRSGATSAITEDQIGVDAMMSALDESFRDDKMTPPTDKVASLDWLKEGHYSSWYHESGVHKSFGPHDDVKIFYNELLENSLKASNSSHPVGSASVKEQYKDGVHYGWSVSVKTQRESDGGNGWYWFETLDRNDISKVAFEGFGNVACTSCHLRPGNRDLILGGYPLK